MDAAPPLVCTKHEALWEYTRSIRHSLGRVREGSLEECECGVITAILVSGVRQGEVGEVGRAGLGRP